MNSATPLDTTNTPESSIAPSSISMTKQIPTPNQTPSVTSIVVEKAHDEEEQEEQEPIEVKSEPSTQASDNAEYLAKASFILQNFNKGENKAMKLPTTLPIPSTLLQKESHDAIGINLEQAAANLRPGANANSRPPSSLMPLSIKSSVSMISAPFSTSSSSSTPSPSLKEDDVKKKHEEKLDELRQIHKSTVHEIEKHQEKLKKVEEEILQQEGALEDIKSKSIVDIFSLPRHKRRFKCVGWRQTGNCDPFGPREPQNDKSCFMPIAGGNSGFCELVDTDTNEHVRVMQTKCNSVKTDANFFCFSAADFVNFEFMSEEAMQVVKKPDYALPKYHFNWTIMPPVETSSTSNIIQTLDKTNGITMVIYPKLLASVFATIRVLRSYDCKLPLELWYQPNEMEVEHNPLIQELMTKYGPINLRAITDPSAIGFNTKAHAIYNSEFSNVLFLDADNVPIRDPSYLFETKEFKETGAIFWPDFWSPHNTIFNIHKDSLLWQLVGLEPVNMFEQESAQLVINREKSALALEVLLFYSFHRPNHFDRIKLAYGDKDLFRLAWMKAKVPFHMIKHVPAVGGEIRSNVFCGMTMVQHDTEGKVLFLHRNAVKLEGKKGIRDRKVWTHMQRFKNTSDPMIDYEITIYKGQPVFPSSQWCYGQRELHAKHFDMIPFNYLIEDEIIDYAFEAGYLIEGEKQPSIVSNEPTESFKSQTSAKTTIKQVENAALDATHTEVSGN
jgi:alpha 1,2-mannosyltransferase